MLAAASPQSAWRNAARRRGRRRFGWRTDSRWRCHPRASLPQHTKTYRHSERDGRDGVRTARSQRSGWVGLHKCAARARREGAGARGRRRRQGAREGAGFASQQSWVVTHSEGAHAAILILVVPKKAQAATKPVAMMIGEVASSASVTQMLRKKPITKPPTNRPRPWIPRYTGISKPFWSSIALSLTVETSSVGRDESNHAISWERMACMLSRFQRAVCETAAFTAM